MLKSPNYDPESDDYHYPPQPIMNEKLNVKFYGEIRKAPDDMWMCFLASDNAFPHALSEYHKKCIDLNADIEYVHFVERAMKRLDKWRNDHPELLKTPDTKGEMLLK